MSVPFHSETEETDRLLALSDGVIAIAITLLVLEISIPEVSAGTPTSVVQELVFEQWNEFLGYALSFLVIGLYWTLHRRIFANIEAHDRGILWLNLLFLLFVAFVPYATSVFSRSSGQFGVSFIAGVLALTGISLALLWIYASRKQLLVEGVPSRAVVIQAARYLASPLVFTVSIGVATVDPMWAVLTWLLLVPINGILDSRLVESLEEKSLNTGQ